MQPLHASQISFRFAVLAKIHSQRLYDRLESCRDQSILHSEIDRCCQLSRVKTSHTRSYPGDGKIIDTHIDELELCVHAIRSHQQGHLSITHATCKGQRWICAARRRQQGTRWDGVMHAATSQYYRSLTMIMFRASVSGGPHKHMIRTTSWVRGPQSETTPFQDSLPNQYAKRSNISWVQQLKGLSKTSTLVSRATLTNPHGHLF